MCKGPFVIIKSVVIEIMSLPGWPQVPPVRKEKPRGRWRPAEISPAIRSRQEGRPYTATSGSCDLSGGITETPLLRPHQSKSFFPGALTESRASGTGSSLRQTRPTLGIVTSEEHSERISALSLRPTRGGGAKRRALCLCVISGKSIGDNGNMALNGAGENLGCGGRWLRGTGSSLLQQNPQPFMPLFPQKSTISPGSPRLKRRRRCCKRGGSGRIASPGSWATTCCVVTACWARRARTAG